MILLNFALKIESSRPPCCIAGNNFGNCYNQATHPIAALLLRSFGVPQPAINVLLETMETMGFFLQTDFGESKTLYGGSHKERLAGHGQGNAAAGPGFTACALAADTGVKQTISEKIIASAAANSQFKRPTQSVVSSGVQMPILSSGTSVNTVQSALTPKSLTPSVSTAISSKLRSYTTPSKASATSATTSPVTLIPVVQNTPTITVPSGVCNTLTPVVSTSIFAKFKTPQRSITRSDMSIIPPVSVVVQEPDKPHSGVFGKLPRVDLSE